MTEICQPAFDVCLKEILHHEGGYVNNKNDPGGRTNLGVTQRVWEEWTGRQASEADMRSLMPENVAPLYRKNYWNKIRGNDLPPALALCVFDFAVNAGPGRAARYLQRMVGVQDDGEIGPLTLRAVESYVKLHTLAGAVKTYQDMRRAYYHALGSFRFFGKGWLRRVDAVERTALDLIA